MRELCEKQTVISYSAVNCFVQISVRVFCVPHECAYRTLSIKTVTNFYYVLLYTFYINIAAIYI